jgi:putative glutamine amidotransferase
MSSKPVIAFTRPAKRGFTASFALRLAIWLSGGKSLKLTSKMVYHDVEFDGLILSGGTDVHPALYNGKPKKRYHYNTPRDEMEKFLFLKAEKAKIPVLAICRGAQLVNILRGGDLHLDVSKAYEKAQYPNGVLARIFYRKPMQVTGKTKLGRIINKTKIRVNSLHTQAIYNLGSRLVISASEANGVVQCIEDPKAPFLIGVQFHPEYLIYSPIFRNLFNAFTQAVIRARSKKSH